MALTDLVKRYGGLARSRAAQVVQRVSRGRRQTDTERMTDVSARVGRLEVGAATDVGRVREANEDSLLVLSSEHLAGTPIGGAVVAVADGMGGHNAGEVASALAVEALADIFGATTAPTDTSGAGTFLRDAMRRANQAVWDAASLDPTRTGMGTTLVCGLILDHGEVLVANVGDSRAYLVSGGGIRQVTRDHSWVADQVTAGRMDAEDAETSPYRNVLTRSLGVAPEVDVDLFGGISLQPGDTLVLCSDGITGYLRPEDLLQLAGDSDSSQAAAERLVRRAVEMGGADNATAVVARLRL